MTLTISIFRYLALRLAVLITVALLITSFIWYLAVIQPRVSQAAELLIFYYELVLKKSNDNNDLTKVAGRSSQDWQIFWGESPEHSYPAGIERWHPYVVSLNKTFVDQGYKAVKFYSSADSEGKLWLQLQPEQPLWIGMQQHYFSGYFSWWLLVWLGLLAALTFLASYLLLQQLTRPFSALISGIQQLSQPSPQPLTLQGVKALQGVIEAFNQAVFRLQKIDQERKIMLAGISHDLRTPLTRIHLALALLPETETLREGILSDLELINEIIEKFRLLAQPEIQENATWLSANALIKEVGKISQITAIDYVLAEDRTVFVPVLTLKRILLNLLDNAKRYGQPPFRVTSRWQESSAVFWQITVEDQGAGIPEDELKLLLQPFVRGKNSQGNAGSGLGLALVNHLVTVLNGQFFLRNRLSGGLQATVILPVKTDF